MKRVLRRVIAMLLLASMICTSQGMVAFADGLNNVNTEAEEKPSVSVQEKSDNDGEGNNGQGEKTDAPNSENEDKEKVEEKKEGEGSENDPAKDSSDSEDEGKGGEEPEGEEQTTKHEEGEEQTTTTTEEKEETTTSSEKVEEETSTTVASEENATAITDEADIATISDAEKIAPAETTESETNIATSSNAKSNEFLANIYADYSGVFTINDDNTVITLEKDSILTNPININSDLTLNLNGYNLTGPDNNYAVIVDNATFTFKDVKHKGSLKGNAEYAVIKSNNSTLNFISGIIKANDGHEAINFEDSNVLIIGSQIYGGNAVDDNKGSAAIVGNYTKDEYTFKAVRGLALGGEGGFTDNKNVKGLGGKAIVLNDKTFERVIDNLPLSTGETGDEGSADGGHAVVLTGSISDEHIVTPTANVLIGGSGGKNSTTKRLKINKGKKPLLFGGSPEDMTDDEKTELAAYTTPDKFITSLKDQDFTGWCYTFAHLAMAETYMLKHYWDYCQEHLFNGEFDLSEVATAFFYREHPQDPLGNAGASRERCNGCNYTSQGGDVETFVNYAAPLRGIQSEEDAVFPDDINNMYQDGAMSEKARSIQNKSVANLTNYKHVAYTGLFDYTRANMIKNIKKSVAKNGSAVIGLTWHSDGVKRIDDTHATFAYQHPLEIMFYWQGGHALQIIGWDDNYSKNNFAVTDLYNNYKANEDATIKKYMSNMHDYDMMWGIDLPYDELYAETKEMLDGLALEGDGAFLCKNSHGNYVWVSYYTSLENCNVFDGEFVPSGTYDYAYYYDGGTSPEEIEVFDAYIDFEAKKDREIIKAISIVATNYMDGVSLTVDKERDGDRDQYVNPTIMKTISLKPGNNFIELSESEQMNLFKGQKFTITLNCPQTTVGMFLGIDKNCTSDDCNPTYYETVVSGRSYGNCTLGNLFDPNQPGLVNMDNFNRINKNYQQLNGNLRIHALTADEANYKRVFLHCGHNFNTYDCYERVHFRKTGTKEKYSCPFELTGNEFLYWEDQDGNHYTADEEVPVGDSDVHLTAKWGPKTYNLYLVDYGASYIDGYVKPTTWTYGQITEFPTAEQMFKPGYRFDGWREVEYDPDSKEFFRIGDRSWIAHDEWFYAKWDKIADDGNVYHTITFKPNGGSGVMYNQFVLKGEWTPIKLNEFMAPPDDAIGNTDFSFGEWGGSDGQHYQNGQNIRLNGDVTLTAYWRARNGYDEKVTISFIAPGIESHMLEQRVKKQNKNVKLNASTLSRAGYEFSHWVERNDDGTFTRIENGGYVNASTDHILYARWKKDGILVNEPLGIPGSMPDTALPEGDVIDSDIEADYVLVTFKPNGAAEDAYTQKVYEGITTKLDANKFTRDGYVFIEWEEDVDYENVNRVNTWKDQDTYKYNNGARTLRAVWLEQEKYNAMQEKIRHDKDAIGAEGDIYYEIKLTRYKAEYNSDTTGTSFVFAGNRLFLHQEINKKGYNFLYFKDQFNNTYPNNSFVYADEDYEITAMWEKDTENYFTVEFRGGDGGSGSMTEQMIKKGTTETLKTCVFLKSGHNFDHWVDLAGNEIEDKGEYTPVEDTILYAIWKAIPVASPAPSTTQNRSSVGSSRSGGGGGGGGGRGAAGGGANGLNPLAADAAKPTQTPINAASTDQAKSTTVTTTKDTSSVKVDPGSSNWMYDPITNTFQLSTQNGLVKNGFADWGVCGTFYFDDKGNMVTGWVTTADNKTYFFEDQKTADEGEMITGWKAVGDGWYYFGADGAMVTNGVTPDGSIVGADGKWIQL